jgi:hypothetical protein
MRSATAQAESLAGGTNRWDAVVQKADAPNCFAVDAALIIAHTVATVGEPGGRPPDR